MCICQIVQASSSQTVVPIPALVIHYEPSPAGTWNVFRKERDGSDIPC